jgi:hypothetical protein
MCKALLAILLAIVGGATATWAQDATTNADVVRKAILAAPLWHVDRSTGTTLWVFEMRGDKLWAKFANSDGKGMRDVQVQVTNDGLILSGSDGRQMTLHYDPQDIQYPFKGTDSQGRTYEFTPK